MYHYPSLSRSIKSRLGLKRQDVDLQITLWSISYLVYMLTLFRLHLYYSLWCICCFTVAAQNDDDSEPSSTMIVHPAGQDVTLSYDLHARNETPGWMIDLTSHGVQSIANGLVAGYSANIFNNNLKIKNITINDDRSGTWYQSVILRSPIEGSHHHEVLESGNITILYVAGEY